MAAGLAGHGAGAVAESLDLHLRVGGREGANSKWCGFFRTSKPLPSDTPLPVRPHLLTLPQIAPPTGD